MIKVDNFSRLFFLSSNIYGKILKTSDAVLGISCARVPAMEVFAAQHPGQVILTLDHRLVGVLLELLHQRNHDNNHHSSLHR